MFVCVCRGGDGGCSETVISHLYCKVTRVMMIGCFGEEKSKVDGFGES